MEFLAILLLVHCNCSNTTFQEEDGDGSVGTGNNQSPCILGSDGSRSHFFDLTLEHLTVPDKTSYEIEIL